MEKNMIVIVAKNKLKPGAAADFIEAAKPLIEASRAEEGNISYELFVDVKDPDTLTFVERWQDEEAVAAHNVAPHFTGALPQLGAFAAAPMEINVYAPVV
jgi:quinol monooxygenase YgiN